jgi:hypothetical protein
MVGKAENSIEWWAKCPIFAKTLRISMILPYFPIFTVGMVGKVGSELRPCSALSPALLPHFPRTFPRISTAV